MKNAIYSVLVFAILFTTSQMAIAGDCGSCPSAKKAACSSGKETCGDSECAPGEMIKLGWITDMNNALTKAKQENKHLLVNFSGSDWCTWCKKLDQEVFSRKAFGDYAEKTFVLVNIDFPSGNKMSPEELTGKRELVHQYGVKGFPTIILLNSEGKKIAQTGYQYGGAQKYIAHLNELLKTQPALAPKS